MTQRSRERRDKTVKDEDVLFLKQHVQICAQSEGRHREGEAYVTEGVNVFIAVVFTLVRIRHGAAEAEALSAGPVRLRKKPEI